MDSSDVILTRNDLNSILNLINISKKTIRNIKQNLFWAFFYNVIGIPVAAGVFYSIFGWLLDPMYGAAAMSLSSVFVVSNALRLRFFKPKHQIIQIRENRKKEEKKMKKVLVEGMMCEHCKAHVEKALNAIDGIQATVDLEKNCAFVEGEADEATLKQAIEEAGYTYKGIE